MKTVILCGGMGTRFAEETQLRPKPMIPIGNQPILSHIMDIYGHYGFDDFVLALGYKQEMVKDYFLNYYARNSDLEIDLATGDVSYRNPKKQKWKVHLVDTGLHTLTGGRIHRLKSLLEPTGTFMVTYGDGLADIDLKKLLAFHKSHGKLVTVTAVQPIARFGGIELKGDVVSSFREKKKQDQGWINGGFFVMEPGVFKYLKGDLTILEREPLENLSRDGQLMAYRHENFWQCMDTLRDHTYLESLWSQQPPWCPWKK